MPDYTLGPFPDGPLFDPHAAHAYASSPVPIDPAVDYRDDHINSTPSGWSTQQVDDALDKAFGEDYEATADDEVAALLAECEVTD